MKRLTILIYIFVLCFSQIAFASTASSPIQSISAIDLTEGRIDGAAANFYFEVPKTWQRFLVADREVYKPNQPILEKLTFYFPNTNEPFKPVFLMSLFVYDKLHWKDIFPHSVVLETQRYIFAVAIASENPIENRTDKAIFNMFLTDVQNKGFLINYINLPFSDKKLLENSITVNGVMLKGESKVFDRIIYLPVREVSEVLGYKVNYIEAQRAISISKGDFYQLFLIDGGITNKNMKVVLYEERAYVPLIFFIQYLKANVDIDEGNNVSIRYYP